MAAEPLLSPGEEATEKVRFGNFEVMNDPEGRPVLLGKGTFGRTYQARHCFLDIIVALKIITERYVADPTVRQRFLTEARAVAKLSHPHIARLYDFGEKDGVLHYAMEYCGGGSLADHVAKNGPLPLRRTIEIAQQISGALKCAHTAGFIHRDLKPSNIMLTAPDGRPFAKLIDFGLVQPSVPGATRSFADDQSADGARFLGTPLFASPEQLREEPMDVRTDLFSLGMTLWFLMAGRAPESGSSAEIAASRLNRESYAARLPANLPPQLRDVLGRLLEKDRKNRFATAADVFNALNACAAALGFRQARDYTEPLAAIDSEDAQATESGALAKLEPVEIGEVTAPLTSEFSIVTRINEDFTGINYVADEVGRKGAMSILHVVHPPLLKDESALDRFRVHIAQLMSLDVAEIVRPKAIKRYSDYVAVISDKPGGTDLLSVLRTERTVPLVEAAPLLEKIADVCDRLCAARLPGVQLAPARIFVERSNGGLSKAQIWLCPRFLAVSEATELARMNEPENTSSTMTTDLLADPARADNMAEHFASLLYRVVAGRNCPVAASLSTQAYVAVPGLSEDSNRILAMVIARQVEDSSCGKVLREVLNAEGIVHRVSGHPSAGFTERPASSTVSPLGTPPFYRGDINREIREKVPHPMGERRAELGIEGAPIPKISEQSSGLRLSKRPRGRRQAQVILLAGSAGALIAGMGIILIVTHRAPRPQPPQALQREPAATVIGQATQQRATAPTGAAVATAAPAVAMRPVKANLLLIAARYQIKDDHKGNSTAQLIAEQCGFAEASGKVVIEPQLDEAAPFFEGLAAVRRGDKFGYIDKTGRVVAEPEWSEVGQFNEGLARVKRGGRPGWAGGKWGFIDKTGNVVIEPQWEWAGDFSDGWAVVSRRTGAQPWDSANGFIDTSGRTVVEPQYKNAYGVSDGMAAVVGKDGCSFIERKSGRMITNPQWLFGVRFSEGLAAVLMKDTHSYGFIDKTGRTVIAPQWSRTGDFTEGIAAVKQFDNKWGFITKEGKYILEPQFEDYYFPFSHGLAVVKKNGKRVLIDMNGRSAVGDWDYADRYQESQYSPMSWIVARQDIDSVHVEWLDSSGKRIWASDAPRSAQSPTNTGTTVPMATAAPVIAVAREPMVTRQSSSYMSWTDRLTEFVRDYVGSTGDSNVEREVSFYAPTADILDEGPKNLDQIRQEIVSYNERWPLRQNSIVGHIQVQEQVRGESYTIGFDQNFYAESAARRQWSKGKVAVTLGVTIRGGVPGITSLKERTLERQKGVLSAAR